MESEETNIWEEYPTQISGTKYNWHFPKARVLNTKLDETYMVVISNPQNSVVCAEIHPIYAETKLKSDKDIYASHIKIWIDYHKFQKGSSFISPGQKRRSVLCSQRVRM